MKFSLFCRFSHFFILWREFVTRNIFLMKVSLFCRFSIFFSYYGGNSLRVRKVFCGCCRPSFSSAFAFLRCFYKTVSSDCPLYSFGGICFGCFTSSVPKLKRLQMQTNLQVEIALQFRSSPPGMQNLGWSHHFSHSIIAGHLICSSLSACLIVNGLRAAPLSNT